MLLFTLKNSKKMNLNNDKFLASIGLVLKTTGAYVAPYYAENDLYFLTVSEYGLYHVSVKNTKKHFVLDPSRFKLNQKSWHNLVTNAKEPETENIDKKGITAEIIYQGNCYADFLKELSKCKFNVSAVKI